MSRYSDLRTVINNSEEYYSVLEARGKNFIEQYPTAVLRQPTVDFRVTVFQQPHVWASGDKFFSLAEKYYDNIRYWYLIAWFNEKPTEHHVSIGETIYIPTPLNKVLSYYNGG